MLISLHKLHSLRLRTLGQEHEASGPPTPSHTIQTSLSQIQHSTGKKELNENGFDKGNLVFGRAAPDARSASLQDCTEPPAQRVPRVGRQGNDCFTFTCGGTVPIAPSSDEPVVKQLTSCLPIDLRWNPSDPAIPASQ